jgi:hypothetical protein
MQKTQQPQQPKIDLKTTTPLLGEDGKPLFFQEAIIFRKVSKFILASDSDGLVPIPCVVEVNSGKILLDMLPKEIRDDYKEFGI